MNFTLSLILLPTLLCAVALAQTPKKSVAVYMAGTEPTAIKGSHKVLGAELAKVLTKSGTYTAVDRSEAGRKIVAQEHIFQRSGAVDMNQIKKLGKQLGVQVVCIAEITEVMKSHYLEARLVDVETAEIFNIASKPGNMSEATDIVRIAQSVAHELLGKAKIVNYSFKEIETNPDMAIDDYTDAIRQQPNMAEYYINRGYAYYFKADYGRAISDFTDAIRLNPNDAATYHYRGYVYANKGDYARAISDYNEVIRLKPNDADVYNNRGNAYDYKGDFDRAIFDYNEAIRLKPNDANAINNRGLAYGKKEDYDRAISDFNEAVRLDPNYAKAYSNRGVTHYMKKDYNRAISDFNEAIRLDPNDVSQYVRRGIAYKKKGDYNKAITDWEYVLRIDPNNSDARKNLEIIKGENHP